MTNCNFLLNEKDLEISRSHTNGETHLSSLEALFINEIKPTQNNKDEYKWRPLLKFVCHIIAEFDQFSS